MVGSARVLAGRLPPATAVGSAPPEAYAGGNDWWHLHTQTCLGLDVQKYPDPDDLTPEECKVLGGSPQKIFPAPDGSPRGVFLLHLWMIQPYEYRPDLFVSGHPCMLAHGVAPQSDPCWQGAHLDPRQVPPTTAAPGHHGSGHGH